MSDTVKNIVFDLGNVLIDWNPKYVFNDTYFDTIEKRDYFFTKICSQAWNEEQDAGRSIVTATQQLINQFPEWEQAIRDYYGRWTEMLGGPIEESVKILRKLYENGSYQIYALTNWNACLFEIALVRYNFLHWFNGRVVSGEESTRKPFPEFYQILFDRYNIVPEETLFIDDNERNIEAAKKLGLKTILFVNPGLLKKSLLNYAVAVT